ncbi:NADP-dependent oxidoreductase [Microbacterium sp. NPDC089695]|uniref:NADP-dependent oxidoreductase n=1 Tax=Microbacterium sp. NPDC089695 TaxID=3364198 RepID=UPI0038048C51
MPVIPQMMRAVRFDEWGDRSVLRVDQVPVPALAAGHVLVQVRAAGLNPAEAMIREGLFDGKDPAKLPSGQGHDLAGTIVVADDVTGFAVDDEVIAWSQERNSHAEYVAVPSAQVVTKPGELSWEVAGSLPGVAATAWAAMHAVEPRAGETIAVSAAAGGVGGIVTQMLVAAGVRVLGIVGEDNLDWVRAQGAEPVLRGEGLAERLGSAAPEGIDAFIDTFGDEYVRLAAALGVSPERIETIFGFAAAREVGAKTEGIAQAENADVVAEVARLVAEGTVELPIAATFSFDEVQSAYEMLEKRRTRGKIALVP